MVIQYDLLDAFFAKQGALIIRKLINSVRKQHQYIARLHLNHTGCTRVIQRQNSHREMRRFQPFAALVCRMEMQ